MRKFSLLLGALGGALGGYLLSNDKLRHELSKAKTPESAAKTLGKHLQSDGKKLAKEVQDFVQSPDVQRNLKKAKHYATGKLKEAKKQVQSYVAVGKKEAVRAAKKGVQAMKKKTA